MARTLREIYDGLAATKAEQPELFDLQPNIDTSQQLLSDLTTTSRVGVWRILLWTVAVAAWALEKLWDAFRDEVNALAAASHIGTLPWYVAKAKAFQYGFPLVVVNNVPAYATDEPGARIIARAAGKEEGGYVLLKVAKLSGSNLVALTTPELDAFREYIDQVKMAGVIVNIITGAPDLIKIEATVYYNPLVLAANGTLILQPTVRPVDDAIRNYIANLDFNGAFVLTELVDAMQAAEGVVNPVLGTVQAKFGAFPYADVDVQYIANAGHAIVDPANDLPVTITYLPHVV